MKLQINNLGAVGVARDVPPWQLPPNAWSSAENARTYNGKIGNMRGYSEFTAPVVPPKYTVGVVSGQYFYWVYAGDAKVYYYDGTNHNNITRQVSGADVDYNATYPKRWNGGVLNNILVLNNEGDVPQYWNPATPATRMQDLPGWDASWRAKVVRTYKYFLVALNMTEGGAEYPYKLRWSVSADPGAVPATWVAAPDNDAGDAILGETGGHIIDAIKLRDSLIIYKEDSAYAMTFVGGNNVFSFRRLSIPGLLAQDCAVEFRGGHFVITQNDVIVHDGQTYKSVVDGKNRDYLFGNIDTDNLSQCFVAHNEPEYELWVCYPQKGSNRPNKALVWNYVYNTWVERDLPGVNHIAVGAKPGVIETFDGSAGIAFDDDTGVFSSKAYQFSNTAMVGAGDSLWQFEDGFTADGAPITVALERVGLDIGDSSDAHFIRRIYPVMEGAPVNFYVGSQNAPNDVVRWHGPFRFDPSSDYQINCFVRGRLHALKVVSEVGSPWLLERITVEYEEAGR